MAKDAQTAKTADAHRPKRSTPGQRVKAYGWALVAALIPIPLVTAIATVGFYLFPRIASLPFVPLAVLPVSWYVIVMGWVIMLVAWLVFALFLAPFTVAERADVGNYTALMGRWYALHKRLILLGAPSDLLHIAPGGEQDATDNLSACDRLIENRKPAVASPWDSEQIKFGALVEACAYVTQIQEQLRGSGAGPGLHWLLGSGYLSLWRQFHHVDEVLIGAEPVKLVIEDALHDSLRLQTASIGARDELLGMQMRAVRILDPDAVPYFVYNRTWDGIMQLAQNRLVQIIETQLAPERVLSMDTPATDGTRTAIAESEKNMEILARATLREVRRIFLDFRDGRWASMLLQRNQLLRALVLTEIGTYILACLGILAGASRAVVLAATAFYAIGATSGLFGRFYGESSKAAFANDYGLSLTRLIATPFFSGVAGIAGPLIVAVIPALTRLVQVPPLVEVFRLDPLSLFIAAVFGLTPNLVMQLLKREADQESPEEVPEAGQVGHAPGEGPT